MNKRYFRLKNDIYLLEKKRQFREFADNYCLTKDIKKKEKEKVKKEKVLIVEKLYEFHSKDVTIPTYLFLINH